MKRKQSKQLTAKNTSVVVPYEDVLAGIVDLLEQARRTSARAVNSIMTATYWEVGRRIVEVEQGGKARAEYGEQVVDLLSVDLTARFGKGFGRRNLFQMKAFYLTWPDATQSPNQIVQPLAAQFDSAALARRFPLPWTHYVMLLSVRDQEAQKFYETEALRGGWSKRQLRRQIGTQFYQRTALSRNKAAMLTKGAQAKPEDAVTPEEEIKDPLVLEFLGLKDEYSESDLEEALIQHLQKFLLELGGDFAFVGRQMRLRIGDKWYQVDLVFFHRRLRALLIIDLKLDAFTHADVGQMHLYCNYAKHHWVVPGENPPIGLILCAEKDAALAEYTLEGLSSKIMVSEYLTALPDKKRIEEELIKTRRLLEARQGSGETVLETKRKTNAPKKTKAKK